ncbi:MAG: hypothetical protein FJZ58_03510, partial [Chlamydiae bacterium]|nr:hypothetical protein [Chlamydiota bacterium]
KERSLKSAAIAALRQIKERAYATELRTQGVQRILSLGIAFQGKKVLVQEEWS